MRVLLADNHVVIRDGLRALLQTHNNFQICGEASNGREAVDLAVQKKPDVVIINIHLPGINGIEATRQIRKHAPGTEILMWVEVSAPLRGCGTSLRTFRRLRHRERRT